MIVKPSLVRDAKRRRMKLYRDSRERCGAARRGGSGRQLVAQARNCVTLTCLLYLETKRIRNNGTIAETKLLLYIFDDKFFHQRINKICIYLF